jgi:dynein heavy chain
VVVRDLNPKSISTQELYGFVNMATREWRDGLLSCTLRELANVPDDNPKWVILDGDLGKCVRCAWSVVSGGWGLGGEEKR